MIFPIIAGYVVFLSYNKKMPKESKSKLPFSLNKWIIISAIIGGIWGLISFGLWSLTSGGPTTGLNPPIIFMILTLPASISIILAYYLNEYNIIKISGSFVVCSIPIFGIIISVLICRAFEKWRKIK